MPGIRWVAMLVLLAAGFFVPVHLIGAWNLVYGYPALLTPVILLPPSIGLCFVVLLLRRKRWGSPRMAGFSSGLKLVLGLTAALYGLFLLDTALSFPNGFDAVSYHADVALKWFLNGTLRTDPRFGWQYTLPGNAELFALAALAARVQKAIALGNFFAAALMAASIYSIAWSFTRRREGSMLAAAIALSIPMVLFQVFELYADFLGTAFLIAAVALLIFRETNLSLYFFLSGYALGIAVGTKQVFWIYAVIFGVSALFVIVRMERSGWKCALLLSAGISLGCGIWFLRAEVTTGNPLYPLRISGGQSGAARGYTLKDYARVRVTSFSGVLALPWSDPAPAGGLPVGPDRGLGVLFAALVLPGVGFLMARAAAGRAGVLEISLLAVTFTGFLLWYAVMQSVIRFGLPMVALACALAAPMLQELLQQNRRLPLTLCAAGILLNGAFCLAEPVRLTLLRARCHNWSRAVYYGYPPLLDRFSEGTRIMDHSRTYRVFALAGAGLTNCVFANGDLLKVDYVLKTGGEDFEDAVLRSDGAELVYNATPRSLYPKVNQQPWRVYRISTRDSARSSAAANCQPLE